jgi:hypothetical protein
MRLGYMNIWRRGFLIPLFFSISHRGLLSWKGEFRHDKR